MMDIVYGWRNLFFMILKKKELINAKFIGKKKYPREIKRKS